MSKQTEKLKKQLLEISDVINAFQSEAVQVKIIDRLLDTMIDWDKESEEQQGKRSRSYQGEEGTNNRESASRKPGATKVLNQLLQTNFFDHPHSIADIATYCKDQYDSEFKTSELSGILLKLSNESKLRRERSEENNRYEYVRA
ncbi:hypothetical protein MUGA111182_03265 [Mucilaginibacter galii]|uniref:Uncharacterized protein n=1 Tax=Mucilaginibacter galii TaxID=2005073 RepID=A0A917J850_9SPHI|nr:hypothetical protein [Mucilaginibacter galii]GGI50409.1 hypothetical protein GCM10011425_16210 [Mucilaginibacter galii]